MEPTIEDLGKLIRRAVKVGANIRFMNNEIDSLALSLKLSDEKTACETFYDVLKAEVERRCLQFVPGAEK